MRASFGWQLRTDLRLAAASGRTIPGLSGCPPGQPTGSLNAACRKLQPETVTDFRPCHYGTEIASTSRSQRRAGAPVIGGSARAGGLCGGTSLAADSSAGPHAGGVRTTARVGAKRRSWLLRYATWWGMPGRCGSERDYGKRHLGIPSRGSVPAAGFPAAGQACPPAVRGTPPARRQARRYHVHFYGARVLAPLELAPVECAASLPCVEPTTAHDGTQRIPAAHAYSCTYSHQASRAAGRRDCPRNAAEASGRQDTGCRRAAGRTSRAASTALGLSLGLSNAR